MKPFLFMIPEIGIETWSDSELVVYPYIQMMCYSYSEDDVVPISVSIMSYYMHGEIASSKTRKILSDGIDSLLSREILFGKKLNKDIYIIKNINKKPEEHFAMASMNYITQIMQSDITKKGSYIRYLLYILLYRNKDRICSQPLEKFAINMNVDVMTIRNYRKNLAKINVLYFKRIYGATSYDGGYSSHASVYSLYEDKLYVDEYVDEKNMEYYKKLIKYTKKHELSPDQLNALQTIIFEHNELELQRANKINGYVPFILDEFRP